jgi:hypothetical protein
MRVADCRCHACADRRVSRRDRAVARRLAAYTGVPERVLIDWRRHGCHWFEVGRRLALPRRIVRAAFTADGWQRFLQREPYRVRSVRHRGHH